MLAPSRRFVPGTVVLGRKFEPRRFGFEDDRKPSRVQVTQGHSLSAFYLYRCPRVSIDKMCPEGSQVRLEALRRAHCPKARPRPSPRPITWRCSGGCPMPAQAVLRRYGAPTA